MAYMPPFGRRTVYLINRHPSRDLLDPKKREASSEFISGQTKIEFSKAAYNDSMLGEVFATKAAAKARMKPDEYFLELEVAASSISHIAPNDQVFIKPGFVPTIKSLTTADSHRFDYDKERGFHEPPKDKRMSDSNRRTYNYNPSHWTQFAVSTLHRPAREVLHLDKDEKHFEKGFVRGRG